MGDGGTVGARGAHLPQDFVRSVNPIPTKGAYYAPHITTHCPTFKTFRRPCIIQWGDLSGQKSQENDQP